MLDTSNSAQGDKRHGFAKVPNHVAYDPTLSPNALKVAVYYQARQGKTGYAFPKQDTTARDTGLSVRAVQRAHSELKQRGALRIGKGREKYRIDWDNDTAFEKAATSGGNNPPPVAGHDAEAKSDLAAQNPPPVAEPEAPKQRTEKDSPVIASSDQINLLRTPVRTEREVNMDSSLSTLGGGSEATGKVSAEDDFTCEVCGARYCLEHVSAASPAASDEEVFPHPPVGVYPSIPERVEDIEHCVDAGLWAIYRTLPQGSEAPNPGLAERLCGKYKLATVYRQVAHLQTRIDFASQRIEKPLALLSRLIESDERPPNMTAVRADRVRDYADAIERGPGKSGIWEDEVPEYARSAVARELKRREQLDAIPF